MSKAKRAPTVDQLVLRTKSEPTSPRTERENLKLVQFWTQKTQHRQLQELAAEESIARGRQVSLATIIRRAIRRELDCGLKGLTDAV